jgi:GNAT superfamily N-acetyltransferase
VSATESNIPEIRIRKAEPSDIPVILDFIHAMATFEKLSDQVNATEELLLESLFTHQPSAEVSLAFSGQEPVGYAVYFENFSSFEGKKGLYLEDLFIKETHRDRGTGKTMLQYLAKVAIERGCTRFEWVVLDWNKKAIAFYKGIGAQLMPEWRVCRMNQDAIEAFSSSER